MKSLLCFLGCMTLVACESSTGGSGLEAAHHDGYFAVVSDNYTGAITISLLGHDGKAVANEWVGSKSKPAGLRTPLSQDVVLPTASFSRRYLTTIERGLGVVTRFDLDDGKVIGQLRTDDSPEGDMAAFHSNPQDVFYVSETSAWVTRWAENPDPSASAAEHGTDLIEFIPSTMKRGKRRIDLSSLDTMLEEQLYDKDGKPTEKVTSLASARPSGLAPAGDFLVVGLVRATDNFSYAEGMVAIVDPVSAELKGNVKLQGFGNCLDVRPVVGETSQVLVGCLGSFGDPGAMSGIAKVEVDSQGKGKIVERFAVADHKAAADATSSVISLGQNIAIGVAPGTLDPATKALVEADAVYRIDLKTGAQTKLWKSTGAFALGIPAFDPASGILLVPDAGQMDKPLYGAQRFMVDDNLKVVHQDFVSVAPKATLAARVIRPL